MSAIWPPIRTLRVQSAGVAVYPPGATYGPRRLIDYEFLWVIEGGGTIHYDEQPIAAIPGMILLCRRGMTDRYDWGQQDRTLHAFFHFSFESLGRGWPKPDTWPVSRQLPVDDVLRPLFRYILGADSLPEPVRSTLLLPCVDFMLRSFIAERLTTATEPHTALPAPVLQALQVICEMTFQEPSPAITLAQLAQASHVSAEHLCRLFRQSLNLTPLDCVRLARLERAATLLRRSNLTIKEVAHSVGFASPFYFSKAFQKTYQTAPSLYRQAIRGGVAVHSNPIVRFLRAEIPKSVH